MLFLIGNSSLEIVSNFLENFIYNLMIIMIGELKMAKKRKKKK